MMQEESHPYLACFANIEEKLPVLVRFSASVHLSNPELCHVYRRLQMNVIFPHTIHL